MSVKKRGQLIVVDQLATVRTGEVNNTLDVRGTGGGGAEHLNEELHARHLRLGPGIPLPIRDCTVLCPD